MDNDTMVEAFKHLNYCQLAKNSLVSKRFRDLICAHRHSLALLDVNCIKMTKEQRSKQVPPNGKVARIFGKCLSSKAYNEWVMRNGYSKQIPLEGQVSGMESTQNDRNLCWFNVNAYYRDPSSHIFNRFDVFFAYAKLTHENWPLYQHFVRLLTDPFIYIRDLELAFQKDVSNLLAESVNPDRNRLKCRELRFYLEVNSLSWIKEHVLCKEVHIYGCVKSNYDEEFLDLFMTGANCSSDISVNHYDLSKVVVNFVQKFMELKTSDEYKFVETIQWMDASGIEEVLEDYAEFMIKEDEDDDQNTTQIFELINNNIGKKLQLTAVFYAHEPYFALDIYNL